MVFPLPMRRVYCVSCRGATDLWIAPASRRTMSYWTYRSVQHQSDKSLVWLKGEVKTPPFSQAARLEAGVHLRRLQRGEVLGLPHSRPMPTIGAHCHELRIPDRDQSWRIIYHVADDAIAILEVFSKKTRATPSHVVEVCRKRLASFAKAAANRERP